MADLSIPFFNRVSLKEKSFFTRQLSVMLNSGLQLAQSLTIIHGQTKNKYFDNVIDHLHTMLERGVNFSTAIARYPNIFDRVYTNIIRSGETSGQLDKVLHDLAKQLEQQDIFRSRLKGALLYPAFILAVMVVVGIIVTVKIIPQLKPIFEEANVELPLATKVIIFISDFIINYWYAIIVAVVLLILIIRWWARSLQGQLIIDRLLIREPTGLILKIYLARFTRTLGMLMQAGVPIVDSVKIVADAIGNTVIQKSLQGVAGELERGVPMSVPLARDRNVPGFVSQMILVGEQTGKLDSVLMGLADYLEEETEGGMKTISTLFEPLLIVILGIGVGFMVFAVIIPIYSIAQAQ